MIELAQGPSGGAISLIVGMGIATYAAVLATIGYFASRFLRQQRDNHRDTLEALQLLKSLRRGQGKQSRRLEHLELVHSRDQFRRWHIRRE
jgi:hypothetical protein